MQQLEEARRQQAERVLGARQLFAAAAAAAAASAAYKTALLEGRAHVTAKAYPAAITAFEAALSAAPNDARALSELGWAAFLAKDLPKARHATEASLAGTASPKLQAASLYNLGRILEAETHPDDAVDAYRRSLELRPNATVAARLKTLAPSSAPVDALTPTTLDGPITSIAAWCKTDDEPETCAPAKPDMPEFAAAVAIDHAPAPWTSVSVFEHGIEGQCALVIRTTAGLFVEPSFAECRVMGGRWDRSISTATAKLEDLVAGGAPELVVRWRVEEMFNDTGAFDSEDAADDFMVLFEVTEDLVTVCALDTKAVPSCTPAIVLKHDESYSITGGTLPDPPKAESWAKDVDLHTLKF